MTMMLKLVGPRLLKIQKMVIVIATRLMSITIRDLIETTVTIVCRRMHQQVELQKKTGRDLETLKMLGIEGVGETGDQYKLCLYLSSAIFQDQGRKNQDVKEQKGP